MSRLWRSGETLDVTARADAPRQERDARLPGDTAPFAIALDRSVLGGWLEERRRRGLDRRDEVWGGVRHMVPEPAFEPNQLSVALSSALLAIARRHGLGVVGNTNIREPGTGDQNDRSPDIIFVKKDGITRFAEGSRDSGYSPEITRQIQPESAPFGVAVTIIRIASALRCRLRAMVNASSRSGRGASTADGAALAHDAAPALAAFAWRRDGVSGSLKRVTPHGRGLKASFRSEPVKIDASQPRKLYLDRRSIPKQAAILAPDAGIDFAITGK